MTKPKSATAPVPLEAAMAAIRSRVQDLRAQIAAKQSERQALAEEVMLIEQWPVCFEDWLPALKDYIQACGRRAAPSAQILRVRGPYTKPFNKRRAAEVGDGEMLFHEVIGLSPDDAAKSPFDALCFYFPEVVFERLSEHYREAAQSWGNEEFPRVAERKARKAELESKMQALDTELQGLREQLAPLLSVSEPHENDESAPEITGEPETLDAQALGD